VRADSYCVFCSCLQYVESHSSWLEKYRNQSPLTVFSKSYCPYSRRAKEMLKGMGAHFEVYEVDLREDAHSLQDGLREFSGHATVSCVRGKWM
jgi:glutaredoxin